MKSPDTATRRALMTLFPALLGPGQVLLVGPHTVYVNNRSEFAEPFITSLSFLLPALAAAVALLVLFGVLLKGRFFRAYLGLLLGLGLALWVQGQWLVADYGLLDGQGIDWQRQAARAPLEWAMWIGLPIVALLLRRRIVDIAPFLSGVLLALQGLTMLLVNPEPEATKNPQNAWSEPPSAIFELSSEHNVIHLVFDAFHSDAFRQIIEEEPERWQSTFDGFTFFADHAGAFPTTVMSLPAMLTGEAYRNQEPILDFTRRSLRHASLLKSLKEQGFETDIATIAPRYAQFHTDNLFRLTIPYVDRALYRRSTAAWLIDLSLFRHAPHSLKPLVYNDQAWLLRSRFGSRDRQHHPSAGRAFFAEWTERLEAVPRPPVYKQIHIGLPHLPAVLDANCDYLGGAMPGHGAYLNQSRCAMLLLERFLDRLRELGLYDRSLIVLSSDHGTRAPPRGFIEAGSGEDWSAIVGAAMALLVIKPPETVGPLAISLAPSAITDLPASIMELLDLPHDFPGSSVFELSEESQRGRTFGYYLWYRERWQAPYLDALHLLNLEGPILDGNSWTFERTIHPPNQDLKTRQLDFGDSTARKHLGIGWSPAERDAVSGESFAWAVGSRSLVFAALPQTSTTLRMRIAVPDFLHPQTITLRLDGETIGEFRSTRSDAFEDFEISVPERPDRPTTSALELLFAEHRQANPEDRAEARRLAARFASIEFDF